MNKDIAEHIFYERGRAEGYSKGLLDGYTKSIVLIRHLQRTLSSHKDPNSQRVTQREILEEAMELIAEKIDPNKEVGL